MNKKNLKEFDNEISTAIAEELNRQIDYFPCDVLFRKKGNVFLCAVSGVNGDFVGVRAKACACVAERIEHDIVKVLGLQLVLCVRLFVGGFQSKADKDLVVVFVLAECGGYVGGERQLQRLSGLSGLFLDFLTGDMLRREIRDGCT